MLVLYSTIPFIAILYLENFPISTFFWSVSNGLRDKSSKQTKYYDTRNINKNKKRKYSHTLLFPFIAILYLDINK